MGKKVALYNLGCKVNAYEMDAMQQMLEEAGYEIVPFATGADIYLINTCTVTNIADRKSRQMLHRARKMNPEAIVAAIGCYVQADAAKVRKDTAVDLLIGNNRKKELVEILQSYERSRQKQECLLPIQKTKEYETLAISRTSGHTRAYIKVQDGCNQFCTYCIIPYARGRVRSRRLSSVIEEVERLGAAGYREVVLTGIHLSSYGSDFSCHEPETLLSLIQAIHQTQGISRIRLGSLEPGIVTEDFAKSLAALPKVCPHFHLSLQSGCDATLLRMNRRYTSAMYKEKCEILRSYFSSPALTTDIIVGFPGETEAEFAASYAFVQQMHFYETHIFKYSRRQGTKAAAMSDQVSEAIKTKRSQKMIALGEAHTREYLESFLGREVEILLEEKKTSVDGKSQIVGYTRQYMQAALPLEGNMRAGSLIKARPQRITADNYMECEAVN